MAIKEPTAASKGSSAPNTTDWCAHLLHEASVALGVGKRAVGCSERGGSPHVLHWQDRLLQGRHGSRLCCRCRLLRGCQHCLRAWVCHMWWRRHHNCRLQRGQLWHKRHRDLRGCWLLGLQRWQRCAGERRLLIVLPPLGAGPAAAAQATRRRRLLLLLLRRGVRRGRAGPALLPLPRALLGAALRVQVPLDALHGDGWEVCRQRVVYLLWPGLPDAAQRRHGPLVPLLQAPDPLYFGGGAVLPLTRLPPPLALQVPFDGLAQRGRGRVNGGAD